MKFFFFILLGFLYSSQVLIKTNLSTSDLGRHLTNGRILLHSDHLVLTQNYYSYSENSFPFVNHHWASGLLFSQIEAWGGFELLSVFFLLLSLLALALIYYTSLQKTNFTNVVLLSFILFPLWIYRNEVRPEVFSLFFLSLIYFLLESSWLFKKRLLILFPLLFVLWVNLHILFPLGFLLIGTYFLKWFFFSFSPPWTWKEFFIFGNQHKKKIIWWVLLFLFCILSLFINPIGLDLVLEPFFILKNYGYDILENQNLFFLLKRNLILPTLLPALIVSLGSLFLIMFLIYLKIKGKTRLSLFLLILFTYLACTHVRSITIWGFMALPLLADLMESVKNYKVLKKIFLIILLLGSQTSHWFEKGFFISPQTGWGLVENVNASADFIKNLSLKGPIFNNYDIGGYLIYHFFPQEKVFVDNRPEAYSVDFFKKIYIPAQEDEKEWEKLLQAYSFNLIYFSRWDLTPWAQNFLIHRIQDQKEWAPIYVDSFVLIFLRRKPENSGWISKYEIPSSHFKIIPAN